MIIYDSPFGRISCNSKEHARGIVIDYLDSLQDNRYSWEGMATIQAFFEELAKDFDLIEEFTENGII